MEVLAQKKPCFDKQGIAGERYIGLPLGSLTRKPVSQLLGALPVLYCPSHDRSPSPRVRRKTGNVLTTSTMPRTGRGVGMNTSKKKTQVPIEPLQEPPNPMCPCEPAAPQVETFEEKVARATRSMSPEKSRVVRLCMESSARDKRCASQCSNASGNASGRSSF